MYSQTRIGTGLSGGFNRIGLYLDAGLGLALNRHQVYLGARYYGPDYVFEKNVVGISTCYSYIFSSGNWYFGPGLSAAFFREKKSSSTLALSEITWRNTFGYEFGNRLALCTSLGLGAVVNNYTNSMGLQSDLSYINYEFSAGIKYYWNSSSDN